MFDVSRIIPFLPLHGFLRVPANQAPENLFATRVSLVTKFAHLGIKNGAHLFFDLSLPFVEGQPSCFVDMAQPEAPQLRMDTSFPEGCEYIGRLCYCINHYE